MGKIGMNTIAGFQTESEFAHFITVAAAVQGAKTAHLFETERLPVAQDLADDLCLLATLPGFVQ